MRQSISKKISEILPVLISNSKEKPFDKTVWKYSDYGDFSYGEIVGFLNGYISGMVETLYGIDLDQPMFEEIHKITENYIEEIRNKISKK